MKKLLVTMLLLSNTVLSQPVNDNACGAINITVENTGCEPTSIYNYSGATWSSGSGNQFCINPGNNLDVWYKFTVPGNGEAIVAIANGDANGYLAELYSSTSCNALTILHQNINGFPCLFTNTNNSSPGTQTYKALTPGSTVYIRTFRYYGNTVQYANGSIKICVSNTNGLADEPCNAGFIPIETADPLSQSCEPVKQYNFNDATLTPAVPNPSCMFDGYYPLIRDVWFKIRIPPSGKINLSIKTGNWDILTYTTSACNATFSEIGCTIWNGVFPVSKTSTFTNLIPNSIMYCRLIANSSIAVPNGQVKICVSDFNSTPLVNNSSKVGIGIDTPFAKLDVVGTGIFRDKLTAASDVEVRGNLIVKGNIISKYGSSVIQGNTTIQGNTILQGNTIIDGGSLKIDSLEMVSRLGNRIALYGGLGNTPKYGFGIQGGTLQMFSDAAASNIVFGYGNSYNFTERARVINQGELGMTVKGRLQLVTGTQSAGLWLTNTANTQNAAFIGLASDNQVGFYGPNGAAWALSMNTITGNVGIGINGVAATRPLSFPASLGEKILLYPGGDGEVGIGVYGGELRLHCDNPGGKVSFGTQDYAGNFDETALAQRNGAFAFSVKGSLWVNGATYASDERFKQNITPIASPLKKLLQLKGVEYEMNTKEFAKNHFSTGRQIGLLAQNVELVVPEAVSEKDGYKGVDYARLVPLLIEAIKMQQLQIETQQTAFNKQQTDILKHQADIAELKKIIQLSIKN